MSKVGSLTEVEQAELVIGKRPITQDSDTVACSQCHRIYPPIARQGNKIAALFFCPHCYGQGHKFRLKALDEAKWWVKFYGWKLEQSQALLDEICLRGSQELVKAMDDRQAEAGPGSGG